MARFEVRMPTYRRPELLRRALCSLIEQTHEDWVCRVLDDDPRGGDMRALVPEISDPRVRLEPNGTNLGVAANIDRAFSLPPLEGTDFVSVLEDDNYYLPRCLAENFRIFSKNSCNVILRNQLAESESSEIYSGDMFTFFGPDGDGMIPRSRLWANMFYGTAAPNSSFFWRPTQGISLSTLQFTDEPMFGELLRAAGISCDVYVARDPLVVWRDNEANTNRRRARRLEQAKWVALQSAFFRELFDYLERQGQAHLIWSPPGKRKIDRQLETFFLLMGLPFRPRSSFRPIERYARRCKYALLRSFGAWITAVPPYKITDDGLDKR